MLRNRNLVRLIFCNGFLALCAAPSILTQEKTSDRTSKSRLSNVVVDLIVTTATAVTVPGMDRR